MKKQSLNKSPKKNTFSFLILLISIIIASFILFVPKISSILIPQKRTEILQNFISDTHKKKDIDLQLYWKFREFYSPGSFIYQPEGLDNPDLQLITIARILSKDFKPILMFHSSRIDSIGGYTSTSALNQDSITAQNKILLHTPTLYLSSLPNNGYLLIFLKPVEKVKKANGFIPTIETKKEKDYWLEISKIKK